MGKSALASLRNRAKSEKVETVQPVAQSVVQPVVQAVVLVVAQSVVPVVDTLVAVQTLV